VNEDVALMTRWRDEQRGVHVRPQARTRALNKR
jgi:hypothetical protein